MKIIPSSGRLIAIGDIHGHSEPLRMLLATINPQKNDCFVFLGDYIDRGPNSFGVIEQILELMDNHNVYCVLGNHEEMLLAAYGGGKSDHDYFLKFGGKETLDSYGVQKATQIPIKHMNFVANTCKDFFETEDFIFVHAGCDVNKEDVSKNGSQVLRWGKINSEMHCSGKMVVCGHKPQKFICADNGVLCIDTGIGLKGKENKLTGIDLKSGDYWQVDDLGSIETGFLA